MLRREDIGVTDHALRQALAEDRCNAGKLLLDNPNLDIKELIIDIAMREIESENPNPCPDLGSKPYDFRAVWEDPRLQETGHLIISKDLRFGGAWAVVTVLSDSIYQQRKDKKTRKKSGLPPFFVVYPNGDGEAHTPVATKDNAVATAEQLIRGGKPATKVAIYQKVEMEVSLMAK
jgi:hypothetical protein